MDSESRAMRWCHGTWWTGQLLSMGRPGTASEKGTLRLSSDGQVSDLRNAEGIRVQAEGTIRAKALIWERAWHT